MHPTPLATALVLIAHGSREEEANADLHYVVEALRQQGRYWPIEAAFLELAQPTIEEAAARCVASGAARVLLLPYFLSAGVHVRRDLTARRQLLATRYPQVEFRLGEPLGRHPLLVQLVAERARQIEERPPSLY